MGDLKLFVRLNEVVTLGKRALPEVPFGGINVIYFLEIISYLLKSTKHIRTEDVNYLTLFIPLSDWTRQQELK